MPADVREAKSETVTVQTGTNKVTLYVPYKVKFNLVDADIATFDENNDDVIAGTYYTRSFGVPKYTRAAEYPNHTVAYWYTNYDDPEGSRFDPTQGGDVNELYAYWQEGDIVYTQDYYDANGSGSIYEINTAEQFMQIYEISKTAGNDFSGRTLNINNDLVLDSTFTGLGGNGTNNFNGTIEGKDHTITVDITTNQSRTGLISKTTNGRVQNLTIEGTITNTNTSSSVGSFMASIDSSGTAVIENCINNATINVVGSGKYGGMVGVTSGATTIKNCTNNGSITSTQGCQLGGMVGYAQQNATITDCTNNGSITVTGGTNTSGGGIVGLLGAPSYQSGTITRCVNKGTVSTGTYNGGGIGGIAGRNYTYTISESYNTADVTAMGAGSVVGGIVGENSGADAKIEKSYNTGIVRGASSGTGSAGGVVGKMSNGTVDQCFNKGIVRSEAGGAETVAPGGVVGTLAGGTVKNVYSTAATVSGPLVTTGGLVGEKTGGYFMQAFTTTAGLPSNAFIFGRGGTASNYCYCDGGTTNDSRAKGDLAMANQTDNNGLPGAYPDVWQAGIDYPTLINCPEPL